jgi:preprotein translocase subunit YajC
MHTISIFTAQAASATAGSSAPGSAILLGQVVPLVLVFVLFYFLLIRPQQKRMKDQRAQINAVKVKDSVVTGGGILGKVTKVDDVYAEVEIATGVKVKVVKSTLADITPFGTKPAND